MLDEKSICVIGCGNMGEALIGGMLTAKLFTADRIIGIDTDRKRAQYIKEKYGINTYREPEKVVGKMQYVILSVKPKDMEVLLLKLKDAVKEDCVIISIAAGIRTDFIEKKIGIRVPVIRVMPNTPALLCLGISGLCRGKHADEIDERNVIEIMSSVGEVVSVEEADMDAVTALSGSGPAYMFYFIEALIAAGVEEGLSMEAAREFAVRNMTGAAYMLMETDESPGALRKKVTSPGGTTEAAIKVFDEMNLKDIVAKAVRNARKKSIELSKGPGDPAKKDRE